MNRFYDSVVMLLYLNASIYLRKTQSLCEAWDDEQSASCCTYSKQHKWKTLCVFFLWIFYIAELFRLLFLKAVIPPLLIVTAL